MLYLHLQRMHQVPGLSQFRYAFYGCKHMATISMELFRKAVMDQILSPGIPARVKDFRKLLQSSLLPKGSSITGIGFGSVWMLFGVVYNYFLS